MNYRNFYLYASMSCISTVLSYGNVQSNPETKLLESDVFNQQYVNGKDSFSASIDYEEEVKKENYLNQSISSREKATPIVKSEKIFPINRSMIVFNNKTQKNEIQVKQKVCERIAWLNKQSYEFTKRSSENVYTNADRNFKERDGLTFSPAYQWLKKQNIKNVKTLLAGIHGTNNTYETDNPGFVAYSESKKKDGTRKINIYVTFHGSQGEYFQSGGGMTGASWLTNYDGQLYQCKAEQIGEIYPVSQADKKIALHRGYALKVKGCMDSLRDSLIKVFEKCKLASYKELEKSLHLSSSSHLTEIIQKVNTANNAHVQVYCSGHSQGGGVAQIAVAYVTSFVGNYLYGDQFDNRIANLCYGIFFSPARAWGSEDTKNFYEAVVGENNMIGYSSIMDVVTCVPLGHNIEKTKVGKSAYEFFSFIFKHILSKLTVVNELIPQDLLTALEAVAMCQPNYATLSNWAFESPVNLLKNYCDNSYKTIKNFVDEIKANERPVENKAETLTQLQATLKNLDNIRRIDNLNAFETCLKKTQEHYFSALNAKGFVGFFSKRYHTLKAVKYMLAALKLCGGASTFISSQHYGSAFITPYIKNKKTYYRVSDLFQPENLSFDLEKCYEFAQKYFELKYKNR